MSLTELDLPLYHGDLPDDVANFLRAADERVTQFVDQHTLLPTGFVPCNFETVYRALRAIADSNLACGNSLCEWGSGFGVVTSLANMLGFNACGIEIDEELVEESKLLADAFGLPADFIQGSFIPEGSQPYAESKYSDHQGQPSWLITDADAAYDELGLEPDDFDVIFAYPWPGEEGTIAGLFDRCAAVGALLLLFDQFNTITLKRKVRSTQRR